MNSDLGNAINGTSLAVPPLPQFKHKNEYGEMVESHKAMSNERGEMRYYTSTISHCKLHRWDGAPIPFINGFCSTDVISTQLYLEDAIADGVQYIRRATEEEVQDWKMKKDPRGTITAEVKASIEADLRAKLEAEIRAKVTDELIQQVADQEKIAGVEGISTKLKEVAASSTKTDGATIIMNQKPVLQGIGSTANIAGNAAGSTSGAAASVAAGLAGLKSK